MTALVNPPVRRVEKVETSPPRWTHADFMRLAPEDRKAELIEGALIIMPPPSFAHERLQGFLFSILRIFADYFHLGQVLGSRTAVRISTHHTYEPDILFVSRARQSIITENEVTEAPDLVIEILSGSTAEYDRGVKREQYEQAGVRELWLIDPYGPAGTQFYQRQGEALVEVAPVDGFIHSLALPNFKLRVAWLWPDEKGDLPNSVAVLKELGVL
ncbi:MAG: Uma2 family endonuclease [Anaerolineales bacterium]|nr:Uma2 family endonuclease [Anaerolineales bacterium]